MVARENGLDAQKIDIDNTRVGFCRMPEHLSILISSCKWVDQFMRPDVLWAM